MKKWILGVSALSTIVTPVAAVVSCGDKSIAQSNSSRAWKNTAEEQEKIVKNLLDKIKELEAKVQKSDADAKALEEARKSLVEAQNELEKLNAKSLTNVREQFDEKLAPLTANLEQNEHDTLLRSTQPRVEHDAEGYVLGRKSTSLEKELEAGLAKGKFITSDLGAVPTIMNSETWLGLTATPESGIHAITDANQHNAEDYTNAKLDESFFAMDTEHKVEFLEDLIFGKVELGSRSGGPVALGHVGLNDEWQITTNGITSVLYSIDESSKTLSVWTKGRSQAVFPTLDEVIKAKNANWQQDQNIVSEMAKVGIAANEKITPEKYLQIIKYFYMPTSEAAAKLFAKVHPWMNGYNMESVADRNQSFDVAPKMSSALAWDFDDYTMNNLGLGAKQVVKSDGTTVRRFDDSDFYTSDTSSQYDTNVWSDQFEMYNGKITSKAWVFDHIFHGQTLLDGVNNWDNGGANRYHGYYSRGGNSGFVGIPFMHQTYGLFLTTHISPTNPNDQILDFIVQYRPSMRVVLRDSITLKGMQPDVSHMWDGKQAEFFNNQNVITQNDATREITTKEFMDSLVKSQVALKGFNRAAEHYLNDGFIGKLIDAVATVNMATITDETAKIILGMLAERKDINLNWFISTINKPASYIQGILLARMNNHYALSLKALQFDNVLNTLIDIAKIVSPDSFKKGDLAHI